MKKLIRIREVKPLENYNCLLKFEDGKEKIVDLEPYLRGPIFKPIHSNIDLFRTMRVIDGAIGWENGADIDPDVLYYDLKPAWMEETISH